MRKKTILFICVSFFLGNFAYSIFADGNNPAEAARTNAKLGLAYLEKGLYPASKERLLTAINDDPKIAAGWYSMAYYLEKTDDNTEAEIYYRKAISIEPHSGSAKNNYGTFLCRLGRYQEAIHQFLSAANETDYLEVAQAYENAGICAMMIPNNSLALTYFHQALNNNPNMPFTLLNLARLNHINGDDASAQKYFGYFKKISLHNQDPKIVAKYRAYVFSAKKQWRLPTP